MQSDTPRTDAESPNLWVVPAEFAKQLERELAAAKAALAEARRMISEINDENERLSAELVSKADELADAIKQRNEANAHLRDACDEIARFRYEHSMIPISRLAEVVAEKRGWDCFEKEGGVA